MGFTRSYEKERKSGEILKSKPTKEQIFNSVTLDKSYYEKSCKQQIELIKELKKDADIFFLTKFGMLDYDSMLWYSNFITLFSL